MKRITVWVLICTIAITVLSPCDRAFAATDRLGLVEFVELFSKQYQEYHDTQGIVYNGFDEDNRTIKTISKDNVVEFSFKGGLIYVDAEDYTVRAYCMLLNDTDDISVDAQEKFKMNMAKCAVAYSVLEYGSEIEKSCTAKYKNIDNARKNIVKFIINLWTNDFDNIVSDKTIIPRIMSGEKVLGKEGNYNYYFLLHPSDRSEIMFAAYAMD